MINLETGDPHTAHTTNPVPFIMTGDPKVFGFAEDELEGKSGGGGEKEPGALCDVAPTILDIMVSFLFPFCLLRLMNWIQGIPQPEGIVVARFET